MLKGLKRKVQNRLLAQSDALYKDKLAKKRDKYNELLAVMLKDVPPAAITTDGQLEAGMEIPVVFIEEFTKGCAINLNADFVIFTSKNGELNKAAPEIMREIFSNPEVVLIYADEDYLKGPQYMKPWLKPDYSPDTLMSFLYMGNPVAVKTEMLKNTMKEMNLSEDGEINYYDFLLRVTEQITGSQIIHCNKVLFSNYLSNDDIIRTTLWGADEKFNAIKENAATRRGLTAAMYCDQKDRWQVIYKPAETEKPTVSVIIPSKDQPELMQECIESLYAKNPDASFEVIVIDNGSAGANRLRMTSLKEKFGFDYYYEPGEFHFAKMCNFGAQKAKGQYLLFLNDDTKMLMDNTLLTMAGQCEVSHVGAVGVKLLYADGETIQHIGVANSKIGPIHKFMGKKDDVTYYYGQNAYPMDVLAVTGACMMIKAALFESIGGFDEIFAVSYNDVDLCYKLHKAGYYNVVRNDISVIHYESMSRGDDAATNIKQERLKKERAALYEKHPDMMEVDPYYSVYIDATQDEFTIQIPGLNKQYNLYELKKETLPVIENEVLKIVPDCVKADDKAVRLEGWWYVAGYNNARYKASLILKNKSQNRTFCIDFEPVLREDVAFIMQGETNVELSGFSVMLLNSELPAGEYETGMLVKDTCSRQKLFRFLGKDYNITI